MTNLQNLDAGGKVDIDRVIGSRYNPWSFMGRTSYNIGDKIY